jgi:protein-disulfide isomerase
VTRTVISAAIVLALTLVTGFGVSRAAKPVQERAVEFRAKGPANPKATIVEFSDFQCPACRAAEPAVKQVLEVYGADVRFVFKHFPLERAHPWARAGATAAECAGRQGKFWEYHDVLYDRQHLWTNEKAAEHFGAYARELKLDAAAFTACRADPSVQKAIDADAQEARDRWVNGTPTFFINGRRFVNGRQLQERGTRLLSQLTGK